MALMCWQMIILKRQQRLLVALHYKINKVKINPLYADKLQKRGFIFLIVC